MVDAPAPSSEPMDCLASLIKYMRVRGIPLDVREYNYEELSMAISVIIKERESNTDDPDLLIRLPWVPDQLVSLHEMDD